MNTTTWAKLITKFFRQVSGMPIMQNATQTVDTKVMVCKDISFSGLCDQVTAWEMIIHSPSPTALFKSSAIYMIVLGLADDKTRRRWDSTFFVTIGRGSCSARVGSLRKKVSFSILSFRFNTSMNWIVSTSLFWKNSAHNPQMSKFTLVPHTAVRIIIKANLSPASFFGLSIREVNAWRSHHCYLSASMNSSSSLGLNPKAAGSQVPRSGKDPKPQSQ